MLIDLLPSVLSVLHETGNKAHETIPDLQRSMSFGRTRTRYAHVGGKLRVSVAAFPPFSGQLFQTILVPLR